MAMLNPDQIRALFEGIRRAPGREAAYAPHKPLLLLLSLGRLQRGLRGHFRFTDIEADLRALLTEFGPSSAPKTRHMPFWFLQSDDQGRLWQLDLPADLQGWPRGTAPGLTVMRRDDVAGGFSTAVEQALVAHPELIPQVARQLLQSTFPDTLHDDIASAVGLDLGERGPVVRDVETPFQREQTQGPPRRRDPAFRERVLRAYEYRCCVCGFDLRVGHMPAGLEAAHIQWHTAGGPDVEPNGLSLCALHHKLFDLGAFTLEPASLRVVFSEHALAGSRGMTGELRHHGQDLLPPVQAGARPAPEFLDWNWRNVFKQKARPLG